MIRPDFPYVLFPVFGSGLICFYATHTQSFNIKGLNNLRDYT